MAPSHQDRLVRNFFISMPTGAQVALFAAAASLEAIDAAVFTVCREHGAQLDDQTVLILRTRV